MIYYDNQHNTFMERDFSPAWLRKTMREAMEFFSTQNADVLFLTYKNSERKVITISNTHFSLEYGPAIPVTFENTLRAFREDSNIVFTDSAPSYRRRHNPPIGTEVHNVPGWTTAFREPPVRIRETVLRHNVEDAIGFSVTLTEKGTMVGKVKFQTWEDVQFYLKNQGAVVHQEMSASAGAYTVGDMKYYVERIFKHIGRHRE